jgi:predicted amidohydrolase YtcJ
MVILSRNPIAVPPEEIRQIKVVKTIVAGKAIYESA